jgi:hypothetical protein
MMARLGPFIESLVPNYAASFLPSSNMMGIICTAWFFAAMAVAQWSLKRIKTARAEEKFKVSKVALPILLISVSLVGLLVGSLWLAKAVPGVAVAIAQDTKPAFDIGGNGNVAVSKVQLCGEMTVIKTEPGSTGSMQLDGFTGIAPNTKCSFPPPTDAMKILSNKDLKARAATLCTELITLDATIDDQISPTLNDKQRRALDQRRTEDFKSLYLERAMELNNAIIARLGGPVDIPDAVPPNEKNPLKAMQWTAMTKHGRSTLLFGKPIGFYPATEVSNYLAFIAEKLPE